MSYRIIESLNFELRDYSTTTKKKRITCLLKYGITLTYEAREMYNLPKSVDMEYMEYPSKTDPDHMGWFMELRWWRGDVLVTLSFLFFESRSSKYTKGGVAWSVPALQQLWRLDISVTRFQGSKILALRHFGSSVIRSQLYGNFGALAFRFHIVIFQRFYMFFTTLFFIQNKISNINNCSGGGNFGQKEFGRRRFIRNLDSGVGEKMLYDTFSAFGVIVQTPKMRQLMQ
ncbi:hypothetical protein C1646_741895 [Rhizophagus diaphanus]|nr:hypothetical protein C1646_741895 [Rhizophagus diaphanus] [Rhizophagus sp. MUCL 43196]